MERSQDLLLGKCKVQNQVNSMPPFLQKNGKLKYLIVLTCILLQNIAGMIQKKLELLPMGIENGWLKGKREMQFLPYISLYLFDLQSHEYSNYSKIKLKWIKL